MKRFIQGEDRQQVTLLPECLNDFNGRNLLDRGLQLAHRAARILHLLRAGLHLRRRLGDQQRPRRPMGSLPIGGAHLRAGDSGRGPRGEAPPFASRRFSQRLPARPRFRWAGL